MGLTSWLSRVLGEPPSLAALVRDRAAGVASGSHVLGMRSWYLPHGGRDEILVRLDVAGGQLDLVHIPLRDGSASPPMRRSTLDAREAGELLVTLGRLSRGPLCGPPVIDGWRVEIAWWDGTHLHELLAHPPAGAALELATLLGIRAG